MLMAVTECSARTLKIKKGERPTGQSPGKTRCKFPTLLSWGVRGQASFPQHQIVTVYKIFEVCVGSLAINPLRISWGMVLYQNSCTKKNLKRKAGVQHKPYLFKQCRHFAFTLISEGMV
jgi:hypothetical protein